MPTLTYEQLRPMEDTIHELEATLDNIVAMVRPIYPDNSYETDAHIVEDLRVAGRNVAILGAKLQGKLAVVQHMLAMKTLEPVPPHKRDVWCNNHHQLDDC